MKKVFCLFVLLLGLLALPAASRAEVTPEGFYAAANLDFVFPTKYYFTINIKDGDDTTKMELQSNSMFGAGLKFGYSFGLEGRVSPRVEFAADYTRGKFDGSMTDTDIDGTVVIKISDLMEQQALNSWGVMFNAIFDVNVQSRFYPYFGAGFGLNFVHMNTTILDEDDPSAKEKISATLYIPQLQALVGVGYNINQRIGLFAEARVDARLGAGVDGMGYDLSALMRPGFTLTAGVRASF